MMQIFVFVAILAEVIFCAPSESQKSAKAYVLKSTNFASRTWVKLGAAPLDHVINLKIGLRQAKIDQLIKHLDQASDPSHSKYGQHLSAAEVNSLIKPEEETSSLVKSWLRENGVDSSRLSYSPAGDWIYVTIPVESANRLLDCTYSTFESEEYGTNIIRTAEWSLPAYLHDHVDTIQPTNSFLKPFKSRSTQSRAISSVPVSEEVTRVSARLAPNGSVAAICDVKLVTPNCLRTLYGTIDYTPKAAGRNKMGMTNYLDELSLLGDTQAFLARFRPDIYKNLKASDTLYKEVSINGGTTQMTPLLPAQIANTTGIEGNLDVQTMLGIAYPTPFTIYSTGGRQPDFKPDSFTPTNTNEPYLDWINYMLALNDTEIPQVISTSYADTEQSVSKDYAIRVCNQFAALGARGSSLLFGSGDEGVGGKQCLRNDGSNRMTYIPEFPPSCPYITVVGGTQNFSPEVAAGPPLTSYTSGGGFGEYFARPSYQEAAVSEYLSQNKNFVNTIKPEMFNASGRAYPDIAAQSVQFGIVWNSAVTKVDGTSAATPAAAAIIALVNDALIASGKPTLGFLNPWLYKEGFKAFEDVLGGSSAGCASEGFPAGKGWDAVTGFGTPNFPKILKALGVADKL